MYGMLFQEGEGRRARAWAFWRGGVEQEENDALPARRSAADTQTLRHIAYSVYDGVQAIFSHLLHLFCIPPLYPTLPSRVVSMLGGRALLACQLIQSASQASPLLLLLPA